jgi:AcrR family transcriptional regulator
MPMPARFRTDQLLDAALDLFTSGGLEAVSMAGVARAVGAPSGSLYHRFAGRPALIAGLWLRTVERFQEGYLEALAGNEPRVAVRHAAEHVLSWVLGHPSEALLLFAHGPEDVIGAETPDELVARCETGRRRLDEAMTQLRHRLDGELSAPQLRFALVDLPYAAVRPYLREGRPPPPEVAELVGRTLDVLLPSQASEPEG